MSKNKKPMAKAKKELIAYIISIIAGAMIVATGVIMQYMNDVKKTDITFIFGIIIACLGAVVIGMSIYGTTMAAKKLKAEKTK